MTVLDSQARTEPATMPSGAFAGEIKRYLVVVGLALTALMVVLEPDVGFTAPPAARLLFWSLQVATGFFVLQWSLYLLSRRLGDSRMPSWLLVLLSGVIGSVVLAPVYWLIGEGMMERWFGYPTQADEEGGGLIDFSPAHPLLQEYADIVGPVTMAWLVVCLPRLHWLVPPLLNAPGGPAATALAEDSHNVADAAEPYRESDPVDRATASASPRATWCERLPTELGTDVIAVASELQYLRVWTSRGCALILGALDDVESESAAQGLRVHRSWWVACKHVVSVRRTATGTVCLMRDGRQIPVSRRRRTEVVARFGDGARYHTADSSKTVADTDLD